MLSDISLFWLVQALFKFLSPMEFSAMKPKNKKGFMVLFLSSESNEYNFFLPCLKILQKRFKHCRFSWPNPDLEVSRKTTALPSSRVICHIADLFPLLRITRENGATAKSHWCSAWLQPLCHPFTASLLSYCLFYIPVISREPVSPQLAGTSLRVTL